MLHVRQVEALQEQVVREMSARQQAVKQYAAALELQAAAQLQLQEALKQHTALRQQHEELVVQHHALTERHAALHGQCTTVSVCCEPPCVDATLNCGCFHCQNFCHQPMRPCGHICRCICDYTGH